MLTTKENNDLIIKLANGNPWALQVITAIIREGPSIDPDMDNPYYPIALLDEMDIRGRDIWLLFSHCCHERMADLLAVLRAIQFGFKNHYWLRECVEKQKKSAGKINFEPLIKRVQKRLPSFNRVVHD